MHYKPRIGSVFQCDSPSGLYVSAAQATTELIESRRDLICKPTALRSTCPPLAQISIVGLNLHGNLHGAASCRWRDPGALAGRQGHPELPLI